ncbi:hypothetical protein CQ12_34470 [Bradyrhizobium jicamae]|uniref:Uncharacterized protein n=1 Tax=Bradyrhizobium jicamae TaxID=280332 RepID=A0A0R3KE09_9BRAD|nr:hypothetical protein CQ12_34470 [Bradyrhizobium jicamae]
MIVPAITNDNRVVQVLLAQHIIMRQPGSNESMNQLSGAGYQIGGTTARSPAIVGDFRFGSLAAMQGTDTEV